MAVNERFIWGTELLRLQPADVVLEIGCGAGILAEQICEKLTAGNFIAIDKSEAMIKMARTRNRAYVDSGKARFVVGEFAKTNISPPEFDKIVAFNVNFFWKNPSKELELIKKYLKPNGLLYVFYQAPYGVSESLKESLVNPLKSNSFEIVDTVIGALSPAALCIVAAAE